MGHSSTTLEPSQNFHLDRKQSLTESTAHTTQTYLSTFVRTSSNEKLRNKNLCLGRNVQKNNIGHRTGEQYIFFVADKRMTGRGDYNIERLFC